MEKKKVYLAGGFNTEWRDEVKTELNLSHYEIYDPAVNRDMIWVEYGTWDTYYIKRCDILFGYMEKTNPSGYGLAAELGYAKALNKTVILIIEPGHEKDKYFQFLKQFADIVYETLEDGIRFLKTF